MKYFTLLYLIYLNLLLVGLFFHHNIVSNALDSFQRELLLDMLRLLFDERVIEHHVVITQNYAITIDRSCNGVVSLLIFWAAILAYHATTIYKLKWIVIGYIVLILANFMRIVFVIYAVLNDQKYFSLAHDYVGNGFLMLIGLTLFILFIDHANLEAQSKP